MSRHRGHGRALTIGALLLVLITSSPAAAFRGPSSFARGIVDQAFGDPSFNWPVRAQQLGASITRLTIDWATIAPRTLPASFDAANPANRYYAFAVADAFVKAAVAHHQQVVLMVLDAPRWAEQHAPSQFVAGTWRPDPRMFGAFGRALALRYSGRFPDPADPGHALPGVSLFQAWNEPNIAFYLNPQWTKTRHGFTAASPILYRRMLNAFYANVKAVQPTAQVLAAGTAPYGDPPGGSRIRPVEFLRDVLCLNGTALTPRRCADPAHADVFDHHPYGPTPTTSALSADDAVVPDLARLERVIRRAVQVHSLFPHRSKPLWVTEIAWLTGGGAGTATLAQQARYIPLAFYLLWHQGIDHVLWLSIRDDKPGGIPPGGLYFNNGRSKPSAAEYGFPFLALTPSHGIGTVWGVAPHRGTVAIQLHSGKWRTVLRVRTNASGLFYATRRLPRHRRWRAVANGSTSPIWFG